MKKLLTVSSTTILKETKTTDQSVDIIQYIRK